MKAVIVGASRGIGRATADRLQADGWETVDLSRTSGVDVTKPDQLADALAAIGTADALVYSAGHVSPMPLTSLSDEEWQATLETNLMGAVRCLRWAADHCRTVVLIASTAGTRPSPHWAAYSASKAALINLGLTAAVELAPRGVTVQTIAPGRCATALRARLAPLEDPESIMQAAEVADVIATLLSRRLDVLSGQVVEVARRG